MSSGRKAPSLRRHIIAISLSAGALVLLLTGGLILFVSWSFMKTEYQEFLTRSTSDLVGEYAESKGESRFSNVRPRPITETAGNLREAWRR